MPDQPSQPEFAGQVAIVTGAAQGLGEATARLLAERGAAGLLLVDRSGDKGEAVAASIRAAGTRAVFIETELADPQAVARVVPAAERSFGRVDVLCNVAGLTDRGGILDADLGLFDRIFAVNVRAPFFLMQDAIRLMQQQGSGGAIANVLSVNAYVGSPALAPYSAAKGALLTLTRNVANAVNADRIRVNGLALGWADTPGEHATLARYHGAGPGWLETAEAGQPFGRLIKPQDVARALAFLVGPQSMPMTGTIMDFSQTVVGAYGGGTRAYPQGGKVVKPA